MAGLKEHMKVDKSVVLWVVSWVDESAYSTVEQKVAMTVRRKAAMKVAY